MSEKIQLVENNLLFESAIKNRGFEYSTIQERMNHHKTPAVSIAVIDDFEVQWVKGYGVCDLNTQIGVNENTLFQAGSISKSVFSFATMRLVQTGVLNLDADVNQYLKSWKIPSNSGWNPKVTLRQILSHTAGFTAHGFTGYKRREKLPDIIQLLNGEKPSTTNYEAVFVDTLPGLQYRYSGGGYTVAQLVVEDILGKTFSEILAEYVLEPLKMSNSTYIHPLPIYMEENVASGYLWHYIPVEGKWYNFAHLGAGGLWTTSGDLAKFGLELMLAIDGKSKLLTRDSALEMSTSYSDNNYGLGLRIKGDGISKRIYHGGCMWGYEAQMTLYCQQGKGVIIMMNSLHEQLIDEIERAVALVYNWAEYLPLKKSELNILNTDLRVYSGKYSNDNGFEFCIIDKESKLNLIYGEQSEIEFIPYGPYKFYSQDINTELEFTTNSSYEVVGMKIIQNGKSIEIKKHT